MNELPILFMSKESPGREGIADRTIDAIRNKIRYGGDLVFYLCVSGSREYCNKLIDSVGSLYHVIWSVYHNTSAGFAWNDMINKIFKRHEFYLRMEDDFLLKEDFNIDTHIELLESNDKVGMVRLGLMPINLNLRSVGWYDKDNQGHIFFDCLPTSSYAYSGNPGLIHKRMHDQVGYFHETHNPGDIEIDFDSRVRQNMVNGGCRIWYPLELGKYGCYGAWSHIGEVKSY